MTCQRPIRTIAAVVCGLVVCGVSRNALGAPVTLQSLLAGGKLESQGMVWDHWQNYSSTGIGGASPADPGRIFVDLNVSDALNPRLLFSGNDSTVNPPLSVPANARQETRFQYDIHTRSVPPGGNLIHLIQANSLEFTGAAVSTVPGDPSRADGSIIFTERNIDEAGLPMAALEVHWVGSEFEIEDHAVFPPQDFLTVFKEITLTGGSLNLPGRSFATILDKFEQGYRLVTEPLTCDTVLKGALSTPRVTREVVGGGNRDVIRADFTPKYVLSLGQAATVCGVHHFNFRNTIIDLPGAWEVEDKGVLVKASGFGVPAPGLLDPLPGGGRFYTDPRLMYGPIEITYGPSFDDNNPSYFDDDAVDTSGRLLQFVDTPSKPADALRYDATEYQRFFTELVGVDANGNIIASYFTSAIVAGFFWKNDQTTAGGGIYDSTLFDPGLEPAISGGIFDVVVPEPSAAHLATVAILGSLCMLCTRKRRAQMARR